MKNFYRVLSIGLCLLLVTGVAFAEGKKLKAGFVYVGDVGDFEGAQPAVAAVPSV